MAHQVSPKHHACLVVCYVDEDLLGVLHSSSAFVVCRCSGRVSHDLFGSWPPMLCMFAFVVLFLLRNAFVCKRLACAFARVWFVRLVSFVEQLVAACACVAVHVLRAGVAVAAVVLVGVWRLLLPLLFAGPSLV